MITVKIYTKYIKCETVEVCVRITEALKTLNNKKAAKYLT